MSNDFDQACRRLIKLKPTDAAFVLWLLGARGADVEFVGWIDTRRVKWPGEPDRTLDSVAVVRDRAANGVPFLIVIEFQIDPDANMLSRLMAYMGDLIGEYKPSEHPGDRFGVLSVVVNLRGKGNCSRTMRLKKGRPGLFTSVGVADVNLEEMDAAKTVEAVARGRIPRPVLAWVPLMRGGQDGKILPRWREVAFAEPNEDVRNALKVATVFAEAAGCEGVWQEGLKEWNTMRSKVVEGWRDEGRDEGQHKERRENFRRVLLARFKTIPEDVEHRIAGADPGTLDRAFDTAVLGSLDQVRAEL